MRVLRAVGGAVLWLLATVVGLLGAVLSITIVLLPIGIPLLLLAGSLFRRSMALLLPRSVLHPVEETGKTAKHKAKRLRKGQRHPGRIAASGDERQEEGPSRFEATPTPILTERRAGPGARA